MNSRYKLFVLIGIVLIVYLTGFFASYPYLLDFERREISYVGTIRNVIEYSIMFLSLITFCVLCINRNLLFKIFGHIVLLVLIINFLLSASCFFIYTQGFNVGMMLSILETNISESTSMIKTLIFPILSAIVYYIMLYYVVIQGRKQYELLSPRIKKYLMIFSFLWLLLPLMFYIKHKYISNKGGGFTIKNAVYHFNDFLNANNLKKELEEVKNTKVEYHLINTKEQPIENIVILIGESARKQNMSLYGYEKETTPFALSQKKNMELYTNSYSPASITNLAVRLC